MSGLPITPHAFPMGSRAEVRLTLDRYDKAVRVDLRTWADFKAGAVETRCATKKGVSLPVALLPDLLAAVVKADALARSLGLLEEGGAEG